MDLVQKIKGWDFRTAASEIDKVIGNIPFEQPKRALDDAKRTSLLNDLWRISKPASAGDPVHRYLAARSLALPENSTCLRYCERTQAPKNVGGGWHPAMVAMVSAPDGTPATLHRTFLGPNGKADIDDPRATMPGPIAEGSAVRLTPVSSILGVAEGIETALSASIIFDMPVWSVINSTMLSKWQPPDGVSEVVIFGDNDVKFGGAAAAYTLAHRLSCRTKISVAVKIPDRTGSDWNDILRERWS